MANLFWGVSDALDLYEEYMAAQKVAAVKQAEKSVKENQPETPTTSKATAEKEAAKNQTATDEVQVETAAQTENVSVEKENLKNDDPPAVNNAGEPAATETDHKEHINTELIEQLEIGAGDGAQEKSQNYVDDKKIILETNLEMNFKPTMEASHIVESIADAIANVEATKETKPPTINVLIYGGGDPRHIIKTMAKRYAHLKDEGNASTVPILKFFIIDGCVEIIARNMVLLGIALERPELISLRNKVHLFMDIYGNTLLRPICYQYLVSKSTTLLKMVSDKTCLEQMASFIKLDNLKYRERDGLQDALEFWSPKPGYDFNIKKYWIERLRRLLAVRYDCRDGVFDWDLNMSLKSRGGQQICSQEYKYWRETGIAFTFPEYEQSKPNKTFAAGLVRNGSRYLHRGYVGDIQTGPFCTFGLRSQEERLHRSNHGENDFRATEVTERNLLEYFYELQNGAPYVHNTEMSNKYGGVRFHMGERLVYDENDLKGICAYDQPWISVEGIEVEFLSISEAKPLAKAAGQWENFFDVAFVGYKFFELLEDTFPKVLRKNSLLILETKLRSTEIKSRITEFETELLNYARDFNLEPVINYNALNSQNSILKFIKN